MKNKILEYNKLIAEFMGVEPTQMHSNKYSYSDMPFFSCTYDTKEEVMKAFVSYAKYHKSWDWIMPVLFKIKKLQSHLNKETPLRNGSISWYGGNWIEIEANCQMSSDGENSFPDKDGFKFRTKPFSEYTEIEAIYEAVVEFVKWYNKHINNEK